MVSSALIEDQSLVYYSMIRPKQAYLFVCTIGVRSVYDRCTIDRYVCMCIASCVVCVYLSRGYEIPEPHGKADPTKQRAEKEKECRECQHEYAGPPVWGESGMNLMFF